MRTTWWVCGLMLVGSAAHAKRHATSHGINSQIFARSDDGKAELVDQYESGPEGGSRRTWVLGGVRFLFSDTLSRGNGSRTEYVSQEDCEKALNDLKARLAQGWSKSQVTVHPEACAAERRAGVVEKP